MSETLLPCAWAVGGYLVGGIPFGYLIGRARGVDVRTVGSRNIGATNVFRTVGKSWGVLALACDIAKGLLPTLAARHFAGGPAWLPLATGVACVVGHTLTPYMKFKGGKGVATSFGMLIALLPGLVGAAFLLFAAVFSLSNYISLGSCSAAVFLAVAVWFPVLGCDGLANPAQCVLVTLMALFVVVKHSANIGRLARGVENKTYLFGKKPAEAGGKETK